MSSKKSSGENGVDSEAAQIDSRIYRAMHQALYAEYRGEGLFEVFSGSGNQYSVDAWDMNCTCADNANGNVCKHLLHVIIVEGVEPGQLNGLFGDQ